MHSKKIEIGAKNQYRKLRGRCISQYKTNQGERIKDNITKVKKAWSLIQWRKTITTAARIKTVYSEEWYLTNKQDCLTKTK